MSAIHDNLPPLLADVHAYRTRCKVVIHSHNSQAPIIFMQEIVGWSTTKTIKTAGSLTVSLVPNENYLNRIHPNDYINLYVDRGDTDGWHRVFFGFVDSIHEDYTEDGAGKPSTRYSLHCSDFQKAFEKSQIYFNPNILQDRSDFNSEWIGTPNLGGNALRTKGVASSGSPPDVLLNNLFVMMGASAQFLMPNGYWARTKNKFRQQRAEFVIGRLQSDILKAVPNGMSTVDFLLQADKLAQGKVPADDLAKVIPASFSAADVQKAVEAISTAAKSLQTLSSDFQYQAKAVIGTTDPAFRTSLLDILDVFTLVEREAIDGYSQDVTIWQKEGSLMNLLMQQSNEAVNEMFFDLRPVIDNKEVALAGGANWSRTPDEIAHNLDDKLPPGVRYVPSLVFREYPFSTIDYVDASNIKLSLSNLGSSSVVGKIQFGSIFSDSPNQKGRHVIEVDNINVEDNTPGPPAKKALKHIDVAVITPSEIISSTFARSDHEHYNLTQFLSDGLLGEAARFYMHDALPIVNPTGIARHGLRVRELTSSFCRFSEHNIPRAGHNIDAAEAVTNSSTPIAFPMHPDSFKASSPYGWRARPNDIPIPVWRFHHGQDMKADKGTPVYAAATGKVVAVARAGTPGFKGYGNCIVIQHDDKYQGETVFSVYAHLDSIDDSMWDGSGNTEKLQTVANATSSLLKTAGRMQAFAIKAGDLIGTVGDTNWVDAKNVQTEYPNIAYHLHFEIIKAFPAKATEIGVPAPVPLTQPRPASPLFPLNSYDPKQWFLANGIDIVREEFIVEGDDKDDELIDQSMPNRAELNTSDVQLPALPKRGAVDNSKVRSQIIRWAMLDDHWYQHNIEYLSGTIRMRGAPEIRVGYRLDINDLNRPLSFYVESVSHDWEYPGSMTTTLAVTRGQPNSPFPVYVLPYLKGAKNADIQRKTDSRLGKSFTLNSPQAAQNGLFISEKLLSGQPEDDLAVKSPDKEMIRGQGSGELYVPAGESIDLSDLGGNNITVEKLIDQSIDLSQGATAPIKASEDKINVDIRTAVIKPNTSNIKK